MPNDLDERVKTLMEEAGQAQAGGRTQDAARIVQRVQAEAPQHPVSLNEAAQQRIRAGDLPGARDLLERATQADPRWHILWLNLAAVLNGLGLRGEEREALDRALKLDPRNLRGLLQSGALYETVGDPRTAAAVYRRALESVPRTEGLPREMQAHLQHAKHVVEANAVALEMALDAALADTRAHHPGETRRVDKALNFVLQKQKVYRQKPSFLYVPELPCIEFYDRDLFPWLDVFEAAFEDIRAECAAVLGGGEDGLEPYVHGLTDRDQWSALNNSRRWSVFYLWRTGQPCEANLARCPKTAEALEVWPKCELHGSSPSAVFSILEPKTAIPPHTGVNNARLTVHLPLIVPPGCWFRVGSETRTWEPGRAFVFDDTIEHEAWNGSDVPRAVMIVDIWNPHLTLAEREMVTKLTACVGDFYGQLPGYL